MVQSFIWAGKLAISTIRPARAGLTKFCPMPPNICLATTMAATLPSAACHKGRLTGRLKASSRPVTTQERSPTVCGRFITERLSVSEATQAPTQTSSMASARQPNSQTEATAAGSRAMRTSSMMVRVDAPLCRWGEEDTIRDFSIQKTRPF